MLCRVCSQGYISETGDVDLRPGYITVKIFWGPKVFDGVIDEVIGLPNGVNGITGYAVYAVNACGERQGMALAAVTASGITSGTETCCDIHMYEATIITQLALGVTEQAFIVVPMTSIGSLEVGWVTSPIVDINNTATIPQASPSVARPMDQRQDGEEDLSPTSATAVIEEGNPTAANQDLSVSEPSPEADESEEEGFPLHFVILGLAVVVLFPLAILAKRICLKKKKEAEPAITATDVLDYSPSKPPAPTPDSPPKLPVVTDTPPPTSEYQAKISPASMEYDATDPKKGDATIISVDTKPQVEIEMHAERHDSSVV